MNQLKTEIISSAVSGIEELQPDTIKQRYRFSPDFIGFCGHFPGNPILPAFVQILMALTLTERHRGWRFEATSVEKAKFRIPLQPDQIIEVACRHRAGVDLAGCEARLSVPDGLAASFRISFYEKENGK